MGKKPGGQGETRAEKGGADAGRRHSETVRVLERMNKGLLERVKELELKRLGRTEREEGYRKGPMLSEEGAGIAARVRDLHGDIDAARDVKEALETDLGATRERLSREKAMRAHLEARVGLLEGKAALGDQLREDIAFVEEEQNRTFRRLEEVVSELTQISDERNGLAQQKTKCEERIRELQDERFDLEAEVLGLKERLAEMVSWFSERRESSD